MSALARAAARVLAAAVLALAATSPAAAQSNTAVLTGTVVSNGAPVAGTTVDAVGGNLTVHATTDASGAFRFPSLPLGRYDLDARTPAGFGAARIDLGTEGGNVTITISPLKTIGRTSVTSRPPVRGSGTDLVLTAENLNRSPASTSIPELLIQLPGAARGANGVVHINGDHGDINYVVDGAPVPQELNRSIGSEVDASNLSFVEILQGAYPAQYGERFATVLNITSRNGVGAPGFLGEVRGGSYGYSDSTVGYHTRVGAGSLVTSLRAERNARFLDPPNFDSPHDAGSNVNQFAKLTLPRGNDFLNLTLSHTHQTFQIPPDVLGGAPAETNDNETQDDLFGTVQYRHPIGDRGSVAFGANYKRSRIRDFGDPSNDFAFGIARNPGAPADCATALLPGSTLAAPNPNSAVAYVNGSCGYSLFGDRTAIDAGANVDYDLRSDKHDVRAGGYYDATHVLKTYAVTLQPGNFLAPILTPSTPGGATTVVDSAPNVGHLAAFYLQDAWKMGRSWQLDYGVRTDTFTVASTEFRTTTGQISPRVKLTRFFGSRASVYGYYGRFFTPFSLENVSPSAAYALNLPLQSNVAAFDLKPQRDSVYELGGHVALGAGDLGLRVMQKNATDLIDDTQVGVTNLHQDINYVLGRIATQSAYYQIGLPRAGRFYVSLTHTYSANKGCETQLLAPCFGAPNDWTPADHDQRYELTSGVTLNDRRGGWFAVDGEYGSGLSSNTCPATDRAPCKRTPHVTLDAEKGFALGSRTALTARVTNLLNDRYYVTIGNAQGTHFARPRSFDLGLRFDVK